MPQSEMGTIRRDSYVIAIVKRCWRWASIFDIAVRLISNQFLSIKHPTVPNGRWEMSRVFAEWKHPGEIVVSKGRRKTNLDIPFFMCCFAKKRFLLLFLNFERKQQLDQRLCGGEKPFTNLLDDKAAEV